MTKSATLTPSWNGPVSVTKLGRLGAAVLKAVREREITVPISRRGRIVAVLTPTSFDELHKLDLDPDDPDVAVTASDIEHGNVSEVIERASQGGRFVVTVRNRPTALLRPAADWEALWALTSPARLGDPTAPLSETTKDAEHVSETVPMQREEVRVEREPITDANRDAGMSGPDISEAEHEVTLHEERPVAEKEVVPKERVRLDKDVVTEQEQVGGEVRKERVEVEGDVDWQAVDRRR